MAVRREPNMTTPGFNTVVSDSWCYSRLKVDKFTNIWAIDNFSLRHEEVGICIQSTKFSASSNDKRKWCLRLYPNGDQEENNEYLSLFLVLVNCDGRKVWAKLKFAILNDKRTEAYQYRVQQPYGFLKGEACGFGQFIKRDFLLDEDNGLLPSDTLTIFCEVTVASDNENLSGQSNAVQFKVPESRLSEDLGSLLENGRFSDVTLSVRGKKFPAHKAILAERSPVFSAMFEHDMKEQTYNRVNITDVDDVVFKEMLSFIYTGRVTSLENIAQDLLPAADKYALERLKVMCGEALCKSLSVDKAVDILVLADRHSVDQLKTQAINFINMHAADVMQTQAWKNMIPSHPHLLAHVLSVMTKQQIVLGGPPFKRVKLG